MTTDHNLEFAFEEGYKLGREHQRETDRRAGDLNASMRGSASWYTWGEAGSGTIVRYRLAEAQPAADPFKAPEGKAERLLKASIGQPQEMGAAEAEEVKVKVTEAMYKAGAAAIEEQRKALGEWGWSDSVAAAIIFRAMYAKMQPAAPDPRIAKLERIASLARSSHDRVNDREFGQFVNHLRSEGWHEQVTSDLVDLRNLFANKPV